MRGRHRRRMSTRIELLDLRAQAITAATTRRARGSTCASPASGCRSVASMRIAVVLPAPFGPSTPYTAPGAHGQVDTGGRVGLAEALLQPPRLDRELPMGSIPSLGVAN